MRARMPISSRIQGLPREGMPAYAAESCNYRASRTWLESRLEASTRNALIHRKMPVIRGTPPLFRYEGFASGGSHNNCWGHAFEPTFGDFAKMPTMANIAAANQTGLRPLGGGSVMRRKSPYFGTCLAGGRRRPGSPEARECPVLKAEARSERARKAARSRWERPATGRWGMRKGPEQGGMLEAVAERRSGAAGPVCSCMLPPASPPVA